MLLATIIAVSTLLDGRGNMLKNTRIVVDNGKIVRVAAGCRRSCRQDGGVPGARSRDPLADITATQRVVLGGQQHP